MCICLVVEDFAHGFFNLDSWFLAYLYVGLRCLLYSNYRFLYYLDLWRDAEEHNSRILLYIRLHSGFRHFWRPLHHWLENKERR